MINKNSFGTLIFAIAAGILISGCGSAAPTVTETTVAATEAAPSSPEIIDTIRPAGMTAGEKEEGAGSGGSPDAGSEGSSGTDAPLVGIVAGTGGIDDGSFNQGAWEGLQRLSGKTGCETRFYETKSEEDFQKNVHDLIDRGGDLCWATGYSSADLLLQEAREHPDTAFAIIDYSYPDTPANMTGVVFRSQESSFLAGFVAGNVTASGKVGFVGGESNEVIDQFRYGYRAGALYAADKLGKTIDVEEVFAGSFTDPGKGKSLALELYKNGCDVVFHASGETGMGVIEAAKETGKYVIGVDKDQSFLAPDNVLTCVLKDVNTAVFRVSGEILDGSEPGGRTVSLGLAESAEGLSENHSLYPEEIYEEMLQLREDIISGKIIPPGSEAEFEKYSGG